MADIAYHSVRAAEARFGHRITGLSAAMLPWVAGLLVFLGAGLVVGLGFAVGWLLIALAVVPYALHHYYAGRLRQLPVGKRDTVSDRLAGDVLGRLPATPTPADIAAAAGASASGIFIGARLGITPTLLTQLASTDAAKTDELLALADEIRRKNNMAEITGSVLAVAIVRSFRGYESIIAQIHLDDEDLDKGIQWQQHLVELVDRHSKPRRTGGIARDWSFGYIPLLERFGQNISEQIGRGSSLLTVDVGSHIDAINQLIDTFATGGRQNAVLVGQAGAGKTTIIHSFAERLLDASSPIPDSLKFRQVFILDSAALISAAPGRGELENLVMQVLNEAYSAKNIIICLDNAQLFFEEGVGAVDLSNVLQPILEAGNLRVILSMDEQRYLQIGQRNPGLINALNRVNIAPASREETLVVMQEQLISTEVRRKATYMYQALLEAYRLSERYVHELAQPGRAVKLLESAAGFHESGLVTMNSVQQAIEKTLDVKISVASDAVDRERLLNMEDLIHQRMVNQTRAVSVVRGHRFTVGAQRR